MQVISVMTPALHLPDWVDSFIAVALIAGLPIALLLAWAFEVTPDGVKRTAHVSAEDSVTAKTGRKLDFAILAGLAVLIVLIAGDQLMPSPENSKVNHARIANADVQQSIAVLPFDDFSPEADQEYFANGISEELLNVLARIDGLRVASRTSAFALKDQDASIYEIAEALDVAHVLEGSIRKSGKTLRITAQLIDTSNDEHMWSETYDCPLSAENIFEIQDEIAKAIVAELKGHLAIQDNNAPARTVSLEAYELYLRAREKVRSRDGNALWAAAEDFKKILTIDPNFALAYSGLADTHLLLVNYGGLSRADAKKIAKPAVTRALQLAPNSAEVLSTAALMAGFEDDDMGRLAYALQAVESNPNYATAYIRLSNAYSRLGQTANEVAAIKSGLKVDPLNPVLLNNLGDTSSLLGDRITAKQAYLDVQKWHPDGPFGLKGLATLLRAEGKYAEAHAILKDAQMLNPDYDSVQRELVSIYTSVGLYDQALALSNESLSDVFIYIMTGQLELADKVLQENVDHPANGFAYFARREFDKANESFNILVEDFKMLSEPILPLYLIDYSDVTYVFQKTNNPLAEDLLQKLDEYFGTKGPEMRDLYNELDAGATLQILKGEPEKAYAWLDRIADLGIGNLTLIALPTFDEIRDTPEFKAREERLRENVTIMRAEIEAQLANPKPGWLP